MGTRTIYLVCCRLTPVCCFDTREGAEEWIVCELGKYVTAERWMYSVSEINFTLCKGVQ